MSDRIQLTDTQRSVAIDRTVENIALLSGAGCGKTYVLARRFTELLLSDRGRDDPLSRFAALTFTEKAALEMLQRVRRMLEQFAAESKGDDLKRFRTWIQDLSEGRISTIHGFCASLLRTHPVEAGVDPNFAVCPDQFVTGQLLEEAAEQAVLQAAAADQQDIAEALTLIGCDRMIAQVRNLVDIRTNWRAEDYQDPKQTLRRWGELCESKRARGWKAFAEDRAFRCELERVEAIPCSDPSDRLASYREEQFGIIRTVLNDPSERTAETLALLRANPGNIGAGKNWGGGKILPRVRDRIKTLVRRAADMSIYTEQIGPPDEQAAKLLTALTRLARIAEVLYFTEKRRRGLLDFTDLLLEAHRLLTDNSSVRKALNGRIEQLLVDEAQDTDAFQIALLEQLVFGRSGGKELPEGRLFLVGDPKQSIYRFRGAQVEVFQDLCRRLGPPRCEKLNRSFRTHPGGIAFVNHLFAPLMGDDYEPISAHRSVCPPNPSVEILLADGPENDRIANARSASAAQAALTARRIAEMVDRPERLVWDESTGDWRAVQYGDIAVLFARMTESVEYERQLALHRIPYYVVAGTGFFRRQEIFDLLNALRCIDNPYDDVGFFGTLRSSLIGLDDNALMHIAEATAPPYLPGLIEIDESKDARDRLRIAVPGLSEEQRSALWFSVGLLANLHRQKDALGPEAILDRLLEATGYEAVLLSQFQGRRMAGNVRMLIERARSADVAGLSLSDFIARMGRQIMAESRYEQAPVAGEGENVVRLMTIHKAKGLEFPVVFIPDLNAGKNEMKDTLLNRVDWGLTYRFRPEGDEEDQNASLPLSYRLSRKREQTDRAAEDVRRLYVAATRHKDHLVFVGANWRTKDGQLRQRDSYLMRMDEVLRISEAIDGGLDRIPYEDGKYTAVVRKITPSRPSRRTAVSPGDKLLTGAKTAAELTDAIIASAPNLPAPTLIGPVPASHGQVELPVTALIRFEHCPMLYRWEYELRTPGQTEGTAGSGRGPSAPLDAASVGTLYHRCMQLLDFARPQSAEVLVRRSICEMNLEEFADVDALTADLEEMLAKFRANPLSEALKGAKQTFRELDFVMRTGPATLRGQIDLLYQDAGGEWNVVDYKSDRLGSRNPGEHALRYELQLLIYAAGAKRHLGVAPRGGTVYFLRPGVAHTFGIDPDKLIASQERLTELANRLVSSRRRRIFKPRASSACALCPYHQPCRSLSAESEKKEAFPVRRGMI